MLNCKTLWRSLRQLDETLRTHMYRATVKNCMSRIDQADVYMKTDKWRKVYNADSFFFRPHS